MRFGNAALITSMLTAMVAAFACGGSDNGDEGSTIDNGGGAGGGVASGGTGGGFGTGGDAGQGASGDGGMEPDTCAGMPCAAFTGEHTFVEADAMASIADLFANATVHVNGTDAAHEPAIIYPSHETMFPINVSHIRHEWSAGMDNAAFRLQFVGANTTVEVYTTSTNWLPTEEEWDWIAESNRGQSVEFSVSALDPANPSDVWTSAPITLLFSRAEVEGAIYYWSTGTEGVMKALVSDPLPVKFYTDPLASDSGTCVACHTLSRDGKRLAVGYGGEKLREVSVPARETIVPPAGGSDRASAWTTFSPDGEMLIVAANGVLTLIDSDTGDTIGPNNGIVPTPDTNVATHPDWSALGDKVVFALGTNGGNKEVEGSSIAVMHYDSGTWSGPDILVQSTGTTDNNFFPVWSPDSRYIAYVNAAGKSKDALTATLRLIRADGGTPITMTRINERVNNEDGVTGIGNSMPTWAPSTRPGIFWLAFSSLRAYATVRPQDDKADQIWIAAVDPTLTSDPSYSGFWAPFQNIEDGNHRAFWTHTEEDRQCRCTDVCGDGLDNDCDGTADESDCGTCAATETCGDGVDNDCDCVIDECNFEICSDGVDNDGDGLADTDDPTCQIR